MSAVTTARMRPMPGRPRVPLIAVVVAGALALSGITGGAASAQDPEAVLSLIHI